ncbi:MAG: hypothetical protein ACRECH_09265 [Nitrososphaerales archaeon]
MRALLTGFEGFASKSNPSGMIARDLDGKVVGDLEIVGRQLPENFYTLSEILRELISEVKPKVIISTGWDYISKIKIEKIALNVMNSQFGDKLVPDNSGNSPIGEEIIKKGPLALKATFPAESIQGQVSRAGIPAELSYHAGTHCCNTVMYSALYHSQRLRPDIVCGFMHVPPIPEMKVRGGGSSAMSLSRETDAIERALIACGRKLQSTKSKT